MYLTYTCPCFKTHRVKIQHQPEWFSALISSAIKQRNNFHRQAIRYDTEVHWREYRFARNQVVHLTGTLITLKTYGK